MLYKEYWEYKTKYYDAQKKYDEVLSEKEDLFARTQPKATQYDKEVVSGGSPGNTFDEYVIAKEKKQIDERLEEAKSILSDREKLLRLKEEELYASADWHDKIFIYKYVCNMSVNEIKYRMPYCRSQIYEILKIIKKNISSDKIGQKL
jgi:hypothetical protein